MEQKKYKLSSDCQTQLRHLRQNMRFSAEDISVRLGKSKAWLGQIERGLLLSIKETDLVSLLSIYTGYTADQIQNNGVLENFITLGFAIENEAKPKNWEADLDIIKDYFYHYLNNYETADERDEQIAYIHSFLRCLRNYPGATSLLIKTLFRFEMILEEYSSLNQDQYFSKVSSLINKISTILDDEANNFLN